MVRGGESEALLSVFELWKTVSVPYNIPFYIDDVAKKRDFVDALYRLRRSILHVVQHSRGKAQ